MNITSGHAPAPSTSSIARSDRPAVCASPPPAEDEIREYAQHLFAQRGSVHGHDCGDWLEAEACLRAHIPKESSQTRMHQHTLLTERAALPLVKHGGK